MNRKENRMVYAAIAAGIFAGDFLLKKQVEEKISKQEEHKILGGRVLVRKYHNKGAALNFMEKSPGMLRIFCGALLLMLGTVWYLLLKNKQNPGVLLGISFILGGGASNLYDRLVKGYVVDYFSFQSPWKRLNHIVFNSSDFCIFLGCILAVLWGEKN